MYINDDEDLVSMNEKSSKRKRGSDDDQKSTQARKVYGGRKQDERQPSSDQQSEASINLRSINKFSSVRESVQVKQKDPAKSTSRSWMHSGGNVSLEMGNQKKGGYEVLEYVVEREDKRLLAVFKLPLLAIVLIVILRSFLVISTYCAIGAVGVLILLTYLHAWNTVVEETLIVTSTLGIQMQQTNILGRLKYAKYVPMENIKAVVINEIIRRQRVISYLLIVLEMTESTGKVMVPLMTGTLPRLRTIEHIYQHVQKVIF